MKIAIIGPGRIGSTFAFFLSRAKHEVTVVARGARLEALTRDPAIVTVDGQRAPISVATGLDLAVPWDLVLVTVLAEQSDALFPALRASAAKQVLFLFNTFEKVDRWREVVGAERFAFGFPTMTAFFVDGRLESTVKAPGMSTTVTSEAIAKVLSGAGLPSTVEPDIESFLRSHAAFVVPTMVAAVMTWQRQTGLTWAEASTLSAAMVEGFEVVRGLGNAVIPGMVAALARLPSVVLTGLLWAAARTSGVRNLGAFGPGEARALIDAMAKAAPGKTPKLLAIRP